MGKAKKEETIPAKDLAQLFASFGPATFTSRLQPGDYLVESFSMKITQGNQKPQKIGGRKMPVIQMTCNLDNGEKWVKTYTPSSTTTLMKHFRRTSNLDGTFYIVSFNGEARGLTEDQISSIPDALEKGSANNRVLQPKEISAQEYCYLNALTAVSNNTYVESLGNLVGETVRVGGGRSTHVVVNDDEDIELETF
jgi:hypothetical protein